MSKFTYPDSLDTKKRENLATVIDVPDSYINETRMLILDYGLHEYDIKDIMAEIRAKSIEDVAFRITLTPENRKSGRLKNAVKEIYRHSYEIKKAHKEIEMYFWGSESLSWVVNAYPTKLSMEPTNACTLDCPECRDNASKIGKMTYEQFRDALYQFKEVDFMTLYDGGESLLHKDISKFIKTAKDFGVKTLQISTSLSLKNDELMKDLAFAGVDRLVIAIDGATPQTYEKFRRNGDFDLVISNIKKIRKHNPECKFMIQFIPNRHNEHELPKMKALSKFLGAEALRIRILRTKDQDLLPQNEMLRFDESNLDDFENIEWASVPAAAKSFICPEAMGSMRIYWSGDIYPCCFMRASIKSMHGHGAQFAPVKMPYNIFERSLHDIWFDEEYFKFRYSFLEHSTCDTCNLCYQQQEKRTKDFDIPMNQPVKAGQV